jgi:hypothetical protein
LNEVPLRNKKSRHRTGHQTIFCFYLLISTHLNCASGAVPQQGVAATERATDFLKFKFISILHKVPLSNKELQHHTGHQPLILLI